MTDLAESVRPAVASRPGVSARPGRVVPPGVALAIVLTGQVMAVIDNTARRFDVLWTGWRGCDLRRCSVTQLTPTLTVRHRVATLR